MQLTKARRKKNATGLAFTPLPARRTYFRACCWAVSNSSNGRSNGSHRCHNLLQDQRRGSSASVPGTCDPGSITYTGPIDVLESETICAIATEVNETNSAPNCATYSIAATQPFSVILRGVKRFKTGPKEFICKPVDEQEHAETLDKLTEWIG